MLLHTGGSTSRCAMPQAMMCPPASFGAAAGTLLDLVSRHDVAFGSPPADWPKPGLTYVMPHLSALRRGDEALQPAARSRCSAIYGGRLKAPQWISGVQYRVWPRMPAICARSRISPTVAARNPASFAAQPSVMKPPT